MRSLPTALLALTVLLRVAVAPAQTGATASDPWRSEAFLLAPKAGGAPYLIQLAFPAGPAPPTGYPAIYVLDAVSSFATVTDTVHWQEQLFGPVLVVGIRYPDALENNRRTFDFTPKPTSEEKQGPAGEFGGEDTFLAFIQDQLKPAIAQRVKVDVARQALFGHSLGGRFTLHVLLTQPQDFDTYVIGSPSIGLFGNEEVLKELPALESVGFVGPPRHVLITTGGLEAPQPEELRFAKQHNIPIPPPPAPGHGMVDAATAMARSLQSVKGVQAQFVEFSGETHNSSIPAYLGRGARFTLLGWFPP